MNGVDYFLAVYPLRVLASSVVKEPYLSFSYVFTLMWILRNLTEDHGGGEGEKKRLEREGAKP